MSTLKCQQLINGFRRAVWDSWEWKPSHMIKTSGRSVSGSPTFRFDGAINLRLASIVVIVTTWGNSTYTRQTVHGGGST